MANDAKFNFYLNRQGARGQKGEKGDPGFSPSITVNKDTADEYTLLIQNEYNNFVTDNLRPTYDDRGGTYVRVDRANNVQYFGSADIATTANYGEVKLAQASDLASTVDVGNSNVITVELLKTWFDGQLADNLVTTTNNVTIQGQKVFATPTRFMDTVRIGNRLLVTQDDTGTITFDSSETGTVIGTHLTSIGDARFMQNVTVDGTATIEGGLNVAGNVVFSSPQLGNTTISGDLTTKADINIRGKKVHLRHANPTMYLKNMNGVNEIEIFSGLFTAGNPSPADNYLNLGHSQLQLKLTGKAIKANGKDVATTDTVEAMQSDLNIAKQDIIEAQGDIDNLQMNKQNKLTAGTGITIDADNVISATGGVVDLPIASSTTLGGIKVGENLTISEDGTLSATGGGSGTTIDDSTTSSASTWSSSKINSEINTVANEVNSLSGDVTTLSGKVTAVEGKTTDLENSVASKQNKLTAGEGLDISEIYTSSANNLNTVNYPDSVYAKTQFNVNSTNKYLGFQVDRGYVRPDTSITAMENIVKYGSLLIPFEKNFVYVLPGDEGSAIGYMNGDIFTPVFSTESYDEYYTSYDNATGSVTIQDGFVPTAGYVSISRGHSTILQLLDNAFIKTSSNSTYKEYYKYDISGIDFIQGKDLFICVAQWGENNRYSDHSHLLHSDSPLKILKYDQCNIGKFATTADLTTDAGTPDANAENLLDLNPVKQTIISSTVQVPTKISELTNDSGFVTADAAGGTTLQQGAQFTLNLTGNGTLGGSTPACTGSSYEGGHPYYYAFKGATSSTPTSELWGPSSRAGNEYLILDCVTPIALQSFRWTNGGNSQERFPVMVFKGSNDNSNYTTLGTYNTQNATDDSVTIENSTPYRYYRFEFPQAASFGKIGFISMSGFNKYNILNIGDNIDVTNGTMNVNLDEIGSELNDLSTRVTTIEDTPILDVPVNNCVLAMPTAPTFDGTNVKVYAGTKVAIANGLNADGTCKSNIVTLTADATINQSTYNGDVTLMLKSDGTIDQTAYSYFEVDDISTITTLISYCWYYDRKTNNHYLVSSTGAKQGPYQRIKIGSYNQAKAATTKYFKTYKPIALEKLDITGSCIPDYSAGVTFTRNADHIAPCDGIVLIFANLYGVASGSCYMTINGVRLNTDMGGNSAGTYSLYFPVAKGDTYNWTDVSAATNNNYTFYPLKGAK